MSHRDIVYDFVRKHHSKFSGIEFNKDVLEEDTFTRLELFLMQRLYTEIVRAKLMFDRESESSEEQSVIFHDYSSDSRDYLFEDESPPQSEESEDYSPSTSPSRVFQLE